jgi:hypothetical protein
VVGGVVLVMSVMSYPAGEWVVSAGRERSKVGQWMGAGSDDDSRAIRGPFKPLLVWCFIAVKVVRVPSYEGETCERA